jgi:Tfp pilus assembly protein PilO
MKYLLLLVAVLALVFFGYGFYASSTPEGKEKIRERDAIKLCWKDHKEKDFDASVKQFIRQACQKMESDYRNKYHSSP